MPKIKIKTRRSLAKRARFTKKGKIKISKACRGHILTKKSRKRKRRLRRPGFVNKTDQRAVRKMLPYQTRT